jgi:Fe-Mn family superoxide dismutase
MILDAFQAGLSWNTIINKRDNFRKAFDNFDPVKISKYGDRKIQSLLNDAGIIRNRLKVNAAVTNAKAFLKVQKEFGSFDQFKKEFSQAAVSAEGSGWAALSHCALTNRPIIMQIENHNVNTYPGNQILLVLDVWEHAYYLDYKNLRAKFVEAFWNIVNWEEAGRRFEDALK